MKLRLILGKAWGFDSAEADSVSRRGGRWGVTQEQNICLKLSEFLVQSQEPLLILSSDSLPI